MKDTSRRVRRQLGSENAHECIAFNIKFTILKDEVKILDEKLSSLKHLLVAFAPEKMKTMGHAKSLVVDLNTRMEELVASINAIADVLKECTTDTGSCVIL
jgi:hypothetical protein